MPQNQRVDFADGTLTLPRLTAGRTIRHSPAAAAALGRPAGRWAPSCMSVAEFAGWRQANAALHHPARRPCADCPLAWHLARLAEGRCNGLPGGV